MRRHFITPVLIALTLTFSFTERSFVSADIDYAATTLQDPRTKIVYYLESDRRHVAAISPDGKLLWCSEVIVILPKGWMGIRPEQIQAIWFPSPRDKSRGDGTADNYLEVSITGEGFGGMQGYIDKRTGKLIPGEVSLVPKFHSGTRLSAQLCCSQFSPNRA